MKVRFWKRIFRAESLLPLLFLMLVACGDNSLPPGVIATVNGEPITLHEVQTLLDSRFSGLSVQADATVDDIRKNYGKALSLLIANTLVRQELQKKGIAPTSQDIDQAIERISSDYDNNGLEETLEEIAMRMEDWRNLMRDHLALEVFRNQILLPAIRIEFQDIKNYYQEHKKDFILPETVRACFLSSLKRAELQDWCDNITNHDFLDDAIAQCVEVPIKEIPHPWDKELKNLNLMRCGKFREEDGEWQSVALIERKSERTPELSEVFPLVEKILLEPKQSAAFEQWLLESSATAKVLLSPGLLDAMIGEDENSLSQNNASPNGKDGQDANGG